MQCPVCKTVSLVMSERQGIEIDYCPQCRGVWLDRGELDKIIEKSASFSETPRTESRPSGYPDRPQHDPYQHQTRHGGYHKKKREGFFSDLFDFD